jgi:MoaA/NifB/PqqE/SkfB family radical SAM enzyme
MEEIWNCALFGVLSDRTDRQDHCAICKDRVYCGGCRARALSYTDDIRAGDPGCRRNQQVWDRLSARTPEFRVLSGR